MERHKEVEEPQSTASFWHNKINGINQNFNKTNKKEKGIKKYIENTRWKL